MSVKKAIRGLAMGMVLAGAAALAIKMREEKNQKKAKAVADHARKVSEKVMAHALKLGRLTKTAYGQIVDAAVAEYKETKDLSAEDLKELKTDLKEGWEGIQMILNDAPAKPAKKAAKKPAKRIAKK